MAINIKSTKDEIFKAYQDAEKARKDLENKLVKAEQELTQAKQNAQNSSKPSVTPFTQTQPIAQPTTKVETKIVYQSAPVTTVEGILATLESVETGLGNAVSELSAKLTLEANEIAELLKQSTEKAEKLKSLYNVVASEDTLDKLIAEYEESQKAFEETAQKSKEDFDKDMATRRQNWSTETQLHNIQTQEQNEKNTKELHREQQEYQYNLQQERNAEKDIYAQKRKALQVELDEVKEAKNIAWAELEKTMKTREEEFEKYKNDFEAFPEKLEKEIKKAEAEGKGIIEKDARVKADLLNREIDSRNRVFDLQIGSLNGVIDGQKAQIASLSKQLEATLKQAQELAIKAIEGSANTDKFDAVREIATELAKNQPKNK
jgi:hypothetical protein